MLDILYRIVDIYIRRCEKGDGDKGSGQRHSEEARNGLMVARGRAEEYRSDGVRLV